MITARTKRILELSKEISISSSETDYTLSDSDRSMAHNSPGYQEIDVDILKSAKPIEKFISMIDDHINTDESHINLTSENEISSIPSSTVAMGKEIDTTDIPNLSSEIDIRSIPCSSDTKCKKYFCMYCQKLVTKFARHLECLHAEEKEVQDFSRLPKGSETRRKIIDEIRKKSSFMYNTNKGYNTGTLIVTRRPREMHNRTVKEFKVCPQCKGFFSKVSLRRHYRNCNQETQLGDKTLSLRSKIAHGQIHKKANTVLRYKIFPRLRSDDVSDIIRFDELAIIYGNKMTDKYRSPHLQKMIRSKLRLIGRLLLELKKINHAITDFASVFNPLFYDDIIKAINVIALYNPESVKYKSPATAFAYGTLLKKSGKTLINEYIKIDNEQKQKTVRNFLSILEDDYGSTINKTVEENQLERKRLKKIVLPNIQDIKLLTDFLTIQRRKYMKQLKNNFILKSWRNLAECTLTSLQVFNRRRAGEIERITINDFESYQSIENNTDYDLYNSLSPEGQQAAKKYVRFLIRGKKGRVVPVLLHEELVECIKIIIKYRSLAQVPKTNPFVFGLPGRDDFNHLSACLLLKQFSQKCNAKIPTALRGTELRKQIATHSLLNDIKENEVNDLCAHLGHARKIHEEHYRLPLASRDIGRMSQLLEKAQGGGEESDDNLEEESMDETDCMNNNEKEFEYASSQSKEVKKDSRKKRSVSPVGYVKRKSWNYEEIECATKLFGIYVENKELPSSEYIATILERCPQLKDRNEIQIKAWINNQLQKNKHKTNNKNTRKRKTTIYWTKEETDVLRTVFCTSLRTGKLPSFIECQQAIDQNPILRLRTKETVKAWVNNEINRKKKLEL